MSQSVLVARPEDVRAFGRNAAALLGQIEFWSTKTSTQHRCTVRRDGYVWVAKARDAWCEELILTPKQYRNALDRLRKAGVVVSERHLHNNKVTAFLRIDKAARDQATEGHSDCAPEGQINSAPEGQNIYCEKEIEKDNSADPAAPPVPEDENMPSKIYGVKEMLAGKKRTESVAVSPDSASKPGQLQSVFKTAWSETYPDEYLPPMTAKALGQLKQFAKACPRGMAGKVLDWCVRNWTIFTSLAESQQGAFKTPERPTAGFLLQYVQTAVNGFKASTEEIAPPKPAKPKPPAPKKAPTPPPPVAEDEEPFITEDELAQMLGYDEDD